MFLEVWAASSRSPAPDRVPDIIVVGIDWTGGAYILDSEGGVLSGKNIICQTFEATRKQEMADEVQMVRSEGNKPINQGRHIKQTTHNMQVV